ncbi:MAG: beta-N-acetylhexosaminidase family protein, partial [Planctomycetota bacterium]
KILYGNVSSRRSIVRIAGIIKVLLVLAAAVNVFAAGAIDLSKAKVVLLNPRSKIQSNAADMVRDEIEKRTRIGLDVVTKMPCKGQAAIVIGVGKKVTKTYPLPAGLELPSKAEGYAIWVDTKKRAAPTICLAGVDERGALYAAGRLLRLLDMGRDSLSLNSDTRIATAPKIGLRGHQQAYRPKTNSYDAWTIEMWEQYYRDMIVFGMNAVELIPPRSDDADDSPHFPRPKMEMMVLMSQLADDYGLDVWIWYPAIGMTTDQEWRVTDTDYTDKKTLDAAIEEWGEVFGKLPRLDVVFVPGGDPGRTHPTVLMPFLEKQKKNLTKYHPNGQMWVSPQSFGYKSHAMGWMPIFLDILKKEQPAWLDGVVFGPQIRMSLPELRKEVPAQYPIRRYPDITHCTGCQYRIPKWDKTCARTVGREPINPRPLAYAKIFRDLYQYSMGFITYSEGCNDDFNKVLWSCLGWDPDMDVKEIATEYSRYFISNRYEEKFAQGLFALERNWVGLVKDNDGIYETLKLFQEMEKNATPQEKLNWRFQQGLYRAYYDAYVKARLHYETGLESQAFEVLKKAKETGAIKAVDQAEAILDKGVTKRVRPELRARTFELAEALYQSIRMQLSVEKYQAIKVQRGANLDNIDKPLNNRDVLKTHFDAIRDMKSERQRLEAIQQIIDTPPTSRGRKRSVKR